VVDESPNRVRVPAPLDGMEGCRASLSEAPQAPGSGVEYVDKAIAYITRGDRFVVFEEPHSPEAGIQIPGGTVEPGESLAAAVLREAYEETGLTNLRLVRALGVQLHRRPSGRVHRRHYFHLVDESEHEQPVWEHYEEHPHSGCAPILYRLRWASLRKPPALHAELDGGLRQLRLGLTQPRRKLRSLVPDAPARRHASRALITDPEHRVLLLQAVVNGREFWVTPGGGVEGDETYCAALVRELAEEVGLAVSVGPIVWVRRYSGADVGNIGSSGEFTELFFHVRVAEPAYRPTRVDDYVVGHKWWSLDELQRSTALFAPRALPTLLPTVLAGGAVGAFDIGL
jgi:8-oxo-dGTP diphosphatase